MREDVDSSPAASAVTRKQQETLYTIDHNVNHIEPFSINSIQVMTSGERRVLFHGLHGGMKKEREKEDVLRFFAFRQDINYSV